MKEEVWKDIEGYEGYYQISNMGRVKSLERTVWNKGRGCYITVSEKIRKGRDNGYGYLYVGLSKDGKVKQCRINRLVSQAFIPNPNNLPEVNHKDENPKNNRVENLEWCDRSYNVNYGTRNKKAAEKTSKPVFSVDKDSGLIMWWASIHEAERCTGINRGNIWSCLKGRQKSAGNHIWFYADDEDAE